MQQLNLLGAARIARFMNALQDPRLIPGDLVWSRRVLPVSAFDEEITARFLGTIQIADIIADDAEAPVYSAGRIQYETVKIPNIKVGRAYNQALLNQMARLTNGQGTALDLDMFSLSQSRMIQACLLGVRQRVEHLIIAMLSDGIGFTYDRFGIKLTNPTWGMYSDLKVTVGTGWDTAGSATPVTDILNLCLVAKQRYGIVYDRVTMSTDALRYMIATTEFQNKARLYLAPNVSFVNLNQQQLGDMANLASRILNLDVETYDARAWSTDVAGVTTSMPLMPITTVILTSKANDGDTSVYDFANGIVTESIVAQLANVNIIGDLAQSFGPVGYTEGKLNPPGIRNFAVQRGWPRKHLLQSSGVLSVGSFSSIVSTSVPFPQ